MTTEDSGQPNNFSFHRNVLIECSSTFTTKIVMNYVLLSLLSQLAKFAKVSTLKKNLISIWSSAPLMIVSTLPFRVSPPL